MACLLLIKPQTHSLLHSWELVGNEKNKKVLCPLLLSCFSAKNKQKNPQAPSILCTVMLSWDTSNLSFTRWFQILPTKVLEKAAGGKKGLPPDIVCCSGSHLNNTLHIGSSRFQFPASLHTPRTSLTAIQTQWCPHMRVWVPPPQDPCSELVRCQQQLGSYGFFHRGLAHGFTGTHILQVLKPQPLMGGIFCSQLLFLLNSSVLLAFFNPLVTMWPIP